MFKTSQFPFIPTNIDADPLHSPRISLPLTLLQTSASFCCPLSRPINQMKLHNQRRFLKIRKHLLPHVPPDTLRHKLELKPPHQLRDNKTHLRVRQVLADAVARAVREGPHAGLLVVREARLVVRVRGRQPALGEEGVGEEEVAAAVGGRVLVDPYFCLVSWFGLLATGSGGLFGVYDLYL